MESILPFSVPELTSLKHYPDALYFRGKSELLKRPKISIIGTRHPNQYTRSITYEIAKKLAHAGIVIVSGAAIGVDTIAHQGAGADNTIAVLPCGIDIRYPVINRDLISTIEQKGLTISQFECGFKAREWSFVVRNEIVVALGDILIVTEADIGSGSMSSVEYALTMGKSIYVLPHRLHESAATRKLLSEGKASAIDDVDRFVEQISERGKQLIADSPFIAYCRTNPTYEDVITHYPNDIFEAELGGLIEVRNGRVCVV